MRSDFAVHRTVKRKKNEMFGKIHQHIEKAHSRGSINAGLFLS